MRLRFGRELHYGARFYDPAVGRWWVTDAADEFYSPYTYVNSNPIVLIDPDGNNAGLSKAGNTITIKANFYYSDQIDPKGKYNSVQKITGAMDKWKGAFESLSGSEDVNGLNVVVEFTLIKVNDQMDAAKNDPIGNSITHTKQFGQNKSVVSGNRDMKSNFASSSSRHGKTIIHEMGHQLGLADRPKKGDFGYKESKAHRYLDHIEGDIMSYDTNKSLNSDAALRVIQSSGILNENVNEVIINSQNTERN